MKFVTNETPWLMKSAAIDVQIGTKIAESSAAVTGSHPGMFPRRNRAVDEQEVPRHEAAEVADKKRGRDNRRELSDDRDLQDGVERDDAALDPVQHHDVAEIPSEQQHANERDSNSR